MSGTISSTSISSFPNLTSITIVNNPSLHGIMPFKSFCNLSHFHYLQMENISISGSIPNCLFSTKKTAMNYSFYVANTLINGSIPHSICTHSSLQTYTLWSNHRMHSTIPDCIGNNINIQRFVINDMYGIYGTVPPSICNLIDLQILKISDTSITGIIPSCISLSLNNLTTFDLKNNKLSGTVPMLNSTKLIAVALNNNSFVGSAQNIFGLDRYPLLHLVTLHNNNLYDSNITGLLRKLLLFSPNLQFFALFGNNRISGSIPDFNSKDHKYGVVLKRLQYFAMHDCDIYGSLPQNVHIGPDRGYQSNGAALTLYGNRLSCDIPQGFERYDPQNLTAFVILGNLLYSDNKASLPQWVSELFQSASNLYLNSSYSMEEKIVFWLGAVVGIYAVYFLFRKKFFANNQNRIQHNDVSVDAFLQNLIAIRQHFGDWTMILCVGVLLILYSQTANYYDCNALLSTFSLCFYYSKNKTTNYILLITIMVFNIVICRTIWRLLNTQSNIRQQLLSHKSIQVHNDTYSIHLISQKQVTSVQSSVTTQRTMTSVMQCFNIFKCILYTLIYLIGLGMIVFYVIVQELPDDNTLNLNSTTRQTINYSISLLLAFNSAIIVPHLVSSYGRYINFFACYRNEIIMILRSIKVVILPIVASFVLLNSCGKGWSKFWEPCSQVNMEDSVFNISPEIDCNELRSLKSYGNVATVTFHLLSSNDVCKQHGIGDIQWNDCLRQFFYKWTIIIMLKCSIIIFVPIMIALWKTFKDKMQKMFSGVIVQPTLIDAQYCMVSTKLEAVVVFAPIQPLIIPIMCMAVQSNKFWYRRMVTVYDWQLTESKHGSTTVPNWFLIYNVLLEQSLMVLFFMYCVDDVNDEQSDSMLYWILIIFFVILDLFGICMVYFCLNRRNKIQDAPRSRVLQQ
eukprot:324727_1